ncbi:hypothetical protein O3M35_005717 [Rhynocoris fuscipes]|uniref:Gustatory receptor n=1 Tax=Rhynocoris fuscipes TaxID=488301 RepID=A0AAW1DLW6_9HEMI
MKIGFAICAEIVAAISPMLHLIALMKNDYFWTNLWYVGNNRVDNHTVTCTVLFTGIISGAILEVVDMFQYPAPTGSGTVLHMICSWISDCSIIIIIVQFCSLLDKFKSHVDFANDKLIMNLFQTPSLLEEAMNSHIQYLKFAKKSNEIFSLQLLTSCVALFNKFLSYLYDTMVDLLMSGLDLQVAIIRVSAAIHCLLYVYFLVKTCQDFRHSADNLNFSIFETSRKVYFSRDIVEVHTYVLMKNQIQFTAAGFFNLDYPIITSMTAMAVTFLVVILQFSMNTSYSMASNSTWLFSKPSITLI